ncbi:hypothetical protein [Achromobacter pestifer]|uniref:Single-stranded DNA-binding protein n=1 Tax=Achromobacter pestifer TaxID=1353889 RepID=A0A6S6Z9X4_9BURK|nr:hypothetical protein [Achromobacter pestifer]CAB3669810.1 hypothetical protein LMG3431_03799 [Achromobacter pestifer]
MLNTSMVGTVVGAPASRFCVDGTLRASVDVQTFAGNGERLTVHVYSILPKIAKSLLVLTDGEGVSVCGLLSADVVFHERRRFGLALSVDATSVSSIGQMGGDHGNTRG